MNEQKERIKMLSEEEQLKKIDRATDKALHEIEKERKDQPRDYIAEWFKWVEKVGKYLRKHILHQKGNMDINEIDKQLEPIQTISNSRQYGMMGLALHSDLKDRLKTYSRKINVPMTKIIRTLITSYLDEKEQQLREEGK